MSFFDFFNLGNSNEQGNTPSIDLSDFKYLSDDHVRIENGHSTNAINKGAWRGIRIKSSDNKTFYVSIYNMNGNHPIWGDNIQMAEKMMKMENENSEKIVLRGFGTDDMGASFSDYGVTLHKTNGKIGLITLHMHDRAVDIKYIKAEMASSSKVEKRFTSFENFKSFLQDWNTNMTRQKKIEITTQADIYNDKAVDFFNNNDFKNAKENFELALEVIPISEMALLNLIICYTKIGAYRDAIEPLKRLNYLNPNNREKAIAYCLLMHLIENFEYDDASVRPTILFEFIKDNLEISTNDTEVKQIMHRINKSYDRDILVYMISAIGFGDSPYMTSEGTTKGVIKREIWDLLSWQ